MMLNIMMLTITGAGFEVDTSGFRDQDFQFITDRAIKPKSVQVQSSFCVSLTAVATLLVVLTTLVKATMLYGISEEQNVFD